MIMQVLAGGSPASNSIRLDAIGTSITYGIGTTGYGATGSGIQGLNSYPQQTEALINNPNLSMTKRGYSGQSAQAYISSGQLNADKISIDSATADKKIVALEWGANDAAYRTSTQLYADIVTIHNALRTNGVKTIVVPILNRKDIYSSANMDSTRLAVNALLFANWNTFSDGIARLDNQPNIYSSNAPDNATYFAVNDVDGLSKVHPTDAGAGLIALEVSKVVVLL